MSKELEIISRSPLETEELGKRVGDSLHAGAVVCLHGELGAGKTVFIRGLTRGYLKAPDVAVTSPTYVLQHIYRNETAIVYHLDTYRIEGGGDEFQASGLDECIRAGDGVVCIEWPERVADALPESRAEIYLAHLSPTERHIRIQHAQSALQIKT